MAEADPRSGAGEQEAWDDFVRSNRYGTFMQTSAWAETKAANGSAGVKNVFDVLRGGIDSTLLALGRSSIAELSPDDVIVPAEFSRGLHK